MKRRQIKMILVALAVIFCGSPLSAQKASEADSVMQQSLELMEGAKWNAAQVKLEKLVQQYGDTGVEKFGAKFGTVWYNKGLCELKLAQQLRRTGGELEQQTKWYQAAVMSFQKCFDINSSELADGVENIYRAKAMMMSGNALQALEKFDQAIAAYEKFLLVRHEARDWYNLSDFEINLAICYWLKQGQTEADASTAQKHFELALAQTRGNKASARSVMTGLMAMLKARLKSHPDDLENFMVKYEQSLRVSLLDAEAALPLVQRMLIDLAEAGAVRSVEVLVRSIPDTSPLDADLDGLLEFLPLFPGAEFEIDSIKLTRERVEGWIKHKAAILAEVRRTEEYALSARAVYSEKLGSYRRSVEAFELLLDEFPKSPHRADYLYNLSRIAVLTGDRQKAMARGKQYLSAFPNHRYTNSFKAYVMVNLYAAQEYANCVEWGEAVLPSLSGDAAERDGILHALGGAYYYLGSFAQAEPYLKQHFEKYPESLYRDASSYLHASVYAKLGRQQLGMKLLDKFINTHAASIYLPFALYDKAFALYSQDKADDALLVLNQMKAKYKESMVIPQMHILLGNIHHAKKNRVQAEREYQAAIRTSKKQGNDYAYDEAHYLMIRLLGKRLWDGLTNKRLLDALPYYDAFIKHNEAATVKSPFFTQIITASIDALEKAGRKLDALESLEKAVFFFNKKPNTPGVEVALKTYIHMLRKEELDDARIIQEVTENQYLTQSAYHQTLALSAKLMVLERLQRRKPNKETKKEIETIYTELIFQHEPKSMDNFTLLKLAHFLENHRGYKNRPLVFYQAILDSGKRIKKYQAQAGLVKELANSNDPRDLSRAVKIVQAILKSPYADYRSKAAAHYQWLEILNKTNDWEQLTKETKVYLHYPQYAKLEVRRVEMLLATSYDKRGMVDDAIGSYTAVWVNSFLNLNQSAPAMDRVVELIWNRNQPAVEGKQDGKSDKQIAYESAYKYIHRTRQHFLDLRPKMTPEAIAAWKRLQQKVDEYGADPSIKKFRGKP